MSAWLGSGNAKDGHHQFHELAPSELRAPPSTPSGLKTMVTTNGVINLGFKSMGLGAVDNVRKRPAR